MKRVPAFALLLVGFLIPGISDAQIVSQPLDTSTFAFADQELGDQPGLSSYLVDDVTLASSTGGGYLIGSVSTSFRQNSGSFAGVTMANLTIIANDGVLDTETIPVQPVAVSVTALGGANFEIAASNLNISLADGDYWFGLTPIADGATLFSGHWAASSVSGSQAQWINPGGDFTLGTQWNPSTIFGEGEFDISLRIDGTEKPVPEPASALLLTAGLIGLVTRRRRS